MTSKEYWDNRAAKRLIEAEKQSNDYIKKVKKIYSKANDDIKKELANVYKNYSKETGIDVHTLKILLSKEVTDEFWKTLKGQGLKKYVQANYKSRINRLEQIQGQLYAKAKEIYKEELNTVYGHYRSVINESYNKTIYDTQIGTGYDFTFNKLDDKMIETVLNTKWYGGNYSSRIWGNTDMLANRVSETIGGALISGKPYYKTANEIADIFGVAQYYAERLVRTETNHFNAEAEALAYKELGVEKYVFVATLDNRTSKMCQEHDGKIYDFKDMETGVNYPPLHPNCRSTTRGYLGEEDEKTLKRRARNPVTGKTEIIDNISYSEWKKQHVNNTVPEFKKNIIQNGEQIYTDYEIDKIANETKKIANKYTKNSSKWSGKIAIDNTNPSAKMWSCDIRSPNITSPHEILHEQLHACSISYYNVDTYVKYKNIEEATVELLAQEISKVEHIPITQSEYDYMTNNLKEINKIISLKKNDLEFAKMLFDIPVIDRLDFLEDKIYDYAKSRTIGEAIALNKLMEVLYVT